MARVRNTFWKKVIDTLVQSENIPVVFKQYINFGTLGGENGYGFRSEGGVIEFKNDAGVWQSVGTGGGTLTWNYLAITWSAEPSFVESITGGDVYSYTLDGTTRYRFVPTTYDATQDAFYSTFVTPTLSGLIVARG